MTVGPVYLKPRRAFWKHLIVLVAVVAVLVLIGILIWGSRDGSRELVKQIPTFANLESDAEVAGILAECRSELLKEPKSIDAWGKLAMTLQAHGYAAEACQCYKVLGSIDPLNPTWPYLQANLTSLGPEPDQSLPLLDTAIRLAGRQSEMPYLRRGLLYLSLGRHDDASADFAQVLNLQPNNAMAQFGLGQIEWLQNKPIDALIRLDRSLEHVSTRKRVAALRVAIFEQLGDRKQVAAEQRRLAELPNDAPWPDSLDERVGQFQVGLRGRLMKATSLGQAGQFPAAVSLLRDTVEKYPNADEPWDMLGRVLTIVGNETGAEAAFARCIQLSPNKADHWFQLGLSRQERKKHKEALEAFRQAISLRPNEASYHVKSSECHLALGQNDAARDALRQAIRLRPDQLAYKIKLDQLK